MQIGGDISVEAAKVMAIVNACVVCSFHNGAAHDRTCSKLLNVRVCGSLMRVSGDWLSPF